MADSAGRPAPDPAHLLVNLFVQLDLRAFHHQLFCGLALVAQYLVVGQKWAVSQILELLDDYAPADRTLGLWHPALWANLIALVAAPANV